MRRSLPTDFLVLWKDADYGVPTLKDAKAEYAKLKRLLEYGPSKRSRAE